MADFFCDISAIGNEYQAYADTPTTWGVPQDGNGRAGPGHSAAVAIATIDVAGCSASGTGAIGVLGVTVSSTLNASGSALATAIVTAINASATAVNTTTISALGRPLNRLVFARVDPGLNTRVQIMLRIAGTDWNGMAPTQANITPAATIGAFAGGANGPFAYLWNFSAAAFGLTGGNNATPNYGIACAASAGITDPTLLNDTIHVRTRRSGANLTLTHSSTSQTFMNLGSVNNGRTFLFDNGTIWAGDDGELFISTTYTSGSGGSTVTIRNGARLIARKKYGFRWRHSGINAGDFSFISSGNGPSWFENLFFEEDPGAGNTRSFAIGPGIVSTSDVGFHIEKGCKWFQKAARGFGITNGSGGGGHARYMECLFTYPVPVSGIVTMPTTGNAHTVEFSRCTFQDINGLSNPVLTQPITGASVRNATRIIFDQCEGVAPFTVLSTWPRGTEAAIIWRAPGEDNSHRVESEGFISEWRPGANIPTLDSLLLSGAPWAYKVMLREITNGEFYVRRPLNLAAKYRGASGIKNVDVEILVPSASVFTTSMLGIDIEYTDSGDVVRRESNITGLLERVLNTAPAIESSTAIWTLNGLTGYAAKRLRVTTQHPVKSGAMVSVSLVSVGTLPGAANSTIYVEPLPVFS